MLNTGALDNTGNTSYTHFHGLNLYHQPMNSRYLRDPTVGEAFMECTYDVNEHNSNNNEYIYGDPSHLSKEDELVTEED